MRLRRRMIQGPRRSDPQTRRLLRGLLALYQQLHTPQPISDLLPAILNTAIRYVPGAQRGSLIVLHGDHGRYAAAHGYDLDQLRSIRLPRQLLEAQFTGARNAQFTNFIRLDEAHLDPATLALMHQHGRITQIRRTLITKIMVRDQLYGTLSLDNLHSHAPFPPTAATLAQIFAEQAGTLIDQALLVDELRYANTRLIESEQLAALGRLIASVAHQLNNPLTAVFGYSELLATEPLDPELLAMVDQLAAAAEQMRVSVRALQLFARQQRSGPTQLNLNLLIEQLATLKRRDLTLATITLQLELDPDLPLTWADGGELSQVLLNLLSNAQQALQAQPQPRQIVIRTALKAHDHGPQLHLSVCDNGPGLPAEVADRLAAPVSEPSQPRAGTGLGLTICQMIVAAHGGVLWSEPGIDGGTAICLALPLRMSPA